MPDRYIEALFAFAADAGASSAMLALAEMACGDGPFCEKPAESYRHVSRAILAGHPDAMNLLGAWHERGRIGAANDARAVACFKLAWEHGSKLGLENHKRLMAKLHQEPSDCLP